MNEFYFVVLSINWTQLSPNLLSYLDPGTGSIIIQAVVAAVVGIGIALKLFWHRILKFLGIRKSVSSENTIEPKDHK